MLTKGRGNCSYLLLRHGLGKPEMIHYVPREKTRGEDSLKRLRAIAMGVWPLDPAMRIERDAASIASAMALIHGGEWRVQIDHLAGVVLVVRQH